MANINRFSEQLIDMAERFADVVDAAQGRGNRKGTLSARWLVLPLAGAGVYALMTNGAFTRQARGVLSDAKERASELPVETIAIYYDSYDNLLAQGVRLGVRELARNSARPFPEPGRFAPDPR